MQVTNIMEFSFVLYSLAVVGFALYVCWVLLCMCAGSLVSIVWTNDAWDFIVSYISVGVLMCCSRIV